MWLRKWSRDLPALEARRANGESIPVLDTRPRLLPQSFPAWRLWCALSPSRPIGMAEGAIPVSEFCAAADLFGVDRCDRPSLWRVIQSVDHKWLEAGSAKSPNHA